MKVLLISLLLNGLNQGYITIDEYPSLKECNKDKYFLQAKPGNRNTEFLCVKQLKLESIDA